MATKEYDMDVERQNMPKVKAWLEHQLKVSLRESTLSEQKEGIDLIDIGSKDTYEIKIRGKKYRKNCRKDILIETVSNDKIDSKGWIEYSKSDYIAIVYEPLDNPIAQLWGLPSLQIWWQIHKHARQWRKIIVPQSNGHNTVNYIIPIGFLDKRVPLTFLPVEARDRYEDGGYKIN